MTKSNIYFLVIVLVLLVSKSKGQTNKNDSVLNAKNDIWIKKTIALDTVKHSNDSIYITVFAKFVVGKNGKVKDVQVIKTVCNTCSDEKIKSAELEAIKMINSMPAYESQENNPRAIDQTYNIPIKFVRQK